VRLGALLEIMRSDPYPAVRRIAMRSAGSLDDRSLWLRFDPTGDVEERTRFVERAVLTLGARVVLPDPVLAEEARRRAGSQAIEIGE
jgi:hypothetical protein